VSERTLEITDKFKGKIMGTRQVELSTDLKTLTMTVRLVGQNKPKNIFVFDREQSASSPLRVWVRDSGGGTGPTALYKDIATNIVWYRDKWT
jgi:hypothetical protein